ncbi:hypothetical protein Tco_0030988 [Tanacetum coccineum]
MSSESESDGYLTLKRSLKQLARNGEMARKVQENGEGEEERTDSMKKRTRSHECVFIGNYDDIKAKIVMENDCITNMNEKKLILPKTGKCYGRRIKEKKVLRKERSGHIKNDCKKRKDLQWMLHLGRGYSHQYGDYLVIYRVLNGEFQGLFSFVQLITFGLMDLKLILLGDLNGLCWNPQHKEMNKVSRENVIPGQKIHQIAVDGDSVMPNIKLQNANLVDSWLKRFDVLTCVREDRGVGQCTRLGNVNYSCHSIEDAVTGSVSKLWHGKRGRDSTECDFGLSEYSHGGESSMVVPAIEEGAERKLVEAEEEQVIACSRYGGGADGCSSDGYGGGLGRVVSDAEVAAGVSIGEIGLMVFIVEGHVLQADVQQRDTQIQQLRTMVTEMGSRESTLMRCILRSERRLAELEKRPPRPKNHAMSDKSSPLKRLVIEINVWVKLPEGDNIFTLLWILMQVTLFLSTAWRESHASHYDPVVLQRKYLRDLLGCKVSMGGWEARLLSHELREEMEKTSPTLDV